MPTLDPHSHQSPLRLVMIMVFALLAALLVISCRPKAGSVVSEQAKTTATVAPATAAPSAAPETATAANPPAGSAGQTPEGAPNKGQKRALIASIPSNTSPSIKFPTPTPTLPPRPTPTVKYENGKIVQEWQAPPEAAQLVNPVKDKPDAVKIGQYYYNQRCVDCHGKEGKGNGQISPAVAQRKHPTNLASTMVQANTDGELFWKITNGRPPMPSNRVRFDDEQRWYIVTFLRTLK